MLWDPPSPPARDLIRQIAQRTSNPEPEWLAEFNRAVLQSNPNVTADPELAGAVSRANLDNLLFWSTANMREPGVPVAANTGAAPMTVARELVRRGFDASALDFYRVGEAVAWRRLMEIAFGLTDNPPVLRETLDICSRSVSAFVDVTLATIGAQIDLERDELTRGTHAERRETVALILDGAPITRQRAESRLGYRLTGAHTAAVVWSGQPDVDLTRIDRAVAALGRVAGATRLLNVLASAATRWVWLPGAVTVDVDRVLGELADIPDVRIAIGATAGGVDGFRRSHLDAVTTQQMMARLDSPQRVAVFADVQLVALITANPEGAAEFVSTVLGDFESADSELHTSVRIFVDEQCNSSRAAARLYTHRNTLLRRLARADELLPRPLADCTVAVAVALDVLRWSARRQ
jgi:DNA-binding PucR family transcriptional regulator